MDETGVMVTTADDTVFRGESRRFLRQMPPSSAEDGANLKPHQRETFTVEHNGGYLATDAVDDSKSSIKLTATAVVVGKIRDRDRDHRNCQP